MGGVVKAVLFNAFGTLINAEGLHLKATKKVLSMINVDLDAEEVHREWCEGIQSAYNKIFSSRRFAPFSILFIKGLTMALALHHIHPSKDEVRRFIEITFKVFKDEACLYPDAFEAIYGLKKRGIKVGIVSNANEDVLNTVLEKSSIIGLFECIIISDVLKVYKPNPKIFAEALRRVKCKPHEAMMVGNSYGDIKGGKDSGLTTVLIDRAGLPTPFPKPDYVVTSLSELIKILEANEALKKNMDSP